MPWLPFRGVALLLSLLAGARGLYAQDNPRNVLRDRGGQKWALLIGVGDYTQVTPLDFCGQDMRDLRERLLEARFPHTNVYLLDDKASSKNMLPFKYNIEAALDRLLGKVDGKGKLIAERQANRDDLVVVAFSGHGVRRG